MSTRVESLPSKGSHLQRSSSGHSQLPPEYQSNDTFELSDVRSVSSSSSLPEYDEVCRPSSSSTGEPSFTVTKRFQIQTQGHPLIAFPIPPKPDPIYVYSVTQDGEIETASYVSLRQSRRSGDCQLFHADNSEGLSLSSTIYRFGPGKPPKIQLNMEDTIQGFEVVSNGCLTRSQSLRTHLGTFEWRYAKRAERRVVNADALLVLDKVTSVSLNGGKQEKRRSQVARLVRNAEFRTAKTHRSTAGNGGRLLLDLEEWVDRKGEAEQMEVLALTSCIMMLKKEVDRRRMHQAIAMSGAGS